MLVLGMAATLAAEERGPLSLSLKRAVEIATSQEGSTPIQLSAESLKQAELRSKEARAALLPDVEGAFSYENRTANLAAMGISLTRLPFPGFEFPTFVGPFLTMDARASVTQSVFDVSSIRKFQASKVGVSAARSDSESAGEQVAAVVARAYLGAVRADTDVETAQANVMLSQAVLRQAENQKNAGTGTGIEITRARVQLANDQQRLLVTENARRAAHLQLLRAMGVRLDTEVQLTDGLQYVPVDALTLENARTQALRDRPDYKAQQEREANARLMASATVMERLPSLAAFGDYGSSGSAFSNSLPTRTYGISLKVPLWDGARRDARRAESASQHRAEAIRTNDVREQIELDVRLALDALSSAQDEVKVAKDGLDLAESELEQARRRYQAGISDSLEVTDAQTRLERARDNQTAALYNYNVARIDLAQAMGVVRRTIQ
ncbi:MAG: TolC family protein [Acidobacteria bacterium Pan2503]|uniref:TolC family protein n=1 Tax=Candidatus Acidiferrum panamense TaxID=2741543 RepID=A0A7V8NPC7_9BACT|nr:TolC family protein [Candidatus Acidoferrum panamensis]